MRKLLVAFLIALLSVGVLPVWAEAPERGEETETTLARLVAEDLPGPEAAVFGVAVEHLPTGQILLSQGDTPFESASLLKLPILYEAYRQRALGDLSFNEELLITERHVEMGYGESSVGPGDTLTVDDALERMVTMSDNAPAVALLDRLGNLRVNQTMWELGLGQTVVDWESTTSAADTLGYFERLARLEGVDAEASREMLSRLLRQRVNDRLPSLLPPGTPVAHKTGNLPGLIHDAGLIYTPAGPVAVSLLSGDVTDDSLVREGMAHLAADVYALAQQGGFGRRVDPPLMWDPVLDDRLRALLPVDGAVGLAIMHLGTGQAVLINADSLRPASSLIDAIEPDAGSSGALSIHQDAEGGSWATSPRRLLDLLVRKARSSPAHTQIAPVGQEMSAAVVFAGLPASAVDDYLGGSDLGFTMEAAVIQAGDQRYVMAVSSTGVSADALSGLGPAAYDYFQACRWGAQSSLEACGLAEITP